MVGLVAICGVYFVLRAANDGDEPEANPHRDGCITLNIAASSEKAALLQQIAKSYIQDDRRFDGKCADPVVTSKASGAALDALAAGWNADKDGPVPQVWTPAASSWVSLLKQRLAAGDKGTLVPDGKLPTIAQSPLVLAMPKPMAEALGWPSKPIGWSDVLGLTNDPNGWGSKGHPEWGRFKLGKTNPHYSTSGLNATIGAYFAATGRSTDLTDKDLSNAGVLQYVKSVESGVVHYGDTTLTFLSNLAAADQAGRGTTYVSAVAVEEKSVYDYNQGNPTGDPALAGKGPKPRVPLVAIYPKEGTLLSDHPYVVLANASDEQKAAANDFLGYVKDSKQQKRFTDLAFRTFEGAGGAGLSTANGLLPDAKFTVIDPPAPQVLEKALTTWDAQRKRAKVLLVLDVSGSMNNDAGNGQTRIELAKKAALQSLTLLAPDDEVGLWTFSTEVNGAATPYTEQVPIGALSANRARLEQVVKSLSAEGGTALYATTRAAQNKVASVADPSRINAVVVLTDGKNEYPKDSDIDALVRDIDTGEKEIPVRVFTIAYGGQADLGVLQRISSASRAAAYDASDPTTIDKVLVNVLSNF
ncbi:extracellular solute-binding protein [Dactylosporangium sp. AC04546]|uniref:substrate-binding domain-containing protein n=1 Tax=Dactylosporangium sp. AC04546 TaxID=2862460 RepID=UPI001EE15166|nr:extracellular solute-binding protein [Dactylosporangium sp. AC04546]WVK85330.1 extracellular solute-binding protein [Dactylosporangium sp. AC04546]